jgi:hypothetical protein
MEIKCRPSPFVGTVNKLLRELGRVNFFEHGLLIGSWPMIVYSQTYGLIYGLRINDIDFAVVNTARKVDGTPIPDLLGQLGYEALTDYQS